MLKPKITNKKFYNKWLYKVTLGMPGVAILRIVKIEEMPTFVFPPLLRPTSTLARGQANKELIIKLSLLLSSWDKTTWQSRIEHSNIDIYTNDKNLYEQIKKEFESILVVCVEPDDQAISILANSSSIIAKKYPHDKYHYKAYLLPHKIQDKAEKAEYLAWLSTQGDKVLISDAVKNWFIETQWNWDRRYMFIEDEKTLLLLKLRRPEVIGRVYDYVVSDK